MLTLGIRSRVSAGLLAAMLLLPFCCLAGMALVGLYSAPDVLLHLMSTTLPGLLFQTLGLALGVMVLTSTMGVLPAWWITTHEFPGRRWIEWLLILPLAMPSYVIAYAYTDALQFSGLFSTLLRSLLGLQFRMPDIRSLTGAILVLSFVLYPYVYLLARASFLARSPSLMDAARSLGYSATRAFLQVALPVARPAWVAGLALVLMEALSEFGALAYFGVQTFTTAIFNTWLNLGDRASAALLSVMLLLMMLGLIVAEGRARGRAQFYTQSGKGQTMVRSRLKPLQAAVVMTLCTLPFLLGFVLPVMFLLVLLQHVDTSIDWARSLAWAKHSAILGFSAAGVSLVLAVFLSYLKRQQPQRWIQTVHRLVALGYGVPGAILAIAILLPLAFVDRFTFEMGWSLPALTGSVVALVYAYNVRFTSAALQAVDAGLNQITRHIDESARVLGRTARQVLWQVHLPILRGPLATGVLLVLVDVVKELPATLVLRPFDFDTLAVKAYQFAADERLTEAAVPSLLIVLVALVPILLLMRQGARQQQSGTGH
ncbi:iron ABC transporter permease [Limnobacter humi]|uniref:Iron ABC transporter permease n=1 Tax=Limnobacter humi TaxID=1778671 RepID=A0ABT1WIC3_9BURK|nr:iron ABC transporter permease [Limnobacter humi]MCQ8897267.1 iron ABC transporter permease [Limnobacter humi]